MTDLVIRSSRPTPLLTLLLPGTLIGHMLRYRDLIRQFAGREVESRHKGTFLGAAWTLINPLMQLLIYTFLFSVVFEMRWGQIDAVGAHAEFALTFFCGNVVFMLFQECATRAPSLILDRPNLVRKVVFPLEILPVSSLLAQLVFTGVGVAVLLGAALIATGSLPVTALLFPLVLVPACLFSFAAGWLLAALGVFIRDIKQVVAVLVQMLFFATPIFYPVANVPEQYRPILMANPFTPIVEMSRQTLLWGEVPSFATLGLLTLGGWAAMQASYAWFMRAKRGFADVV